MSTKKAIAGALGEGAARGVLEPLAKVVSGWLGRKVPANSWLRSETGVSFASGLGQFVEALASKTPVGRVSSDFVGDVLKSAFSNGGQRPSAHEVTNAGTAWVADFLKSAEKRIWEAKSEDLPDLGARLKVELRFKKEVWEEIKKDMAGLDSKESGNHIDATPFDWSDNFARIDDWLGQVADQLGGGAKKSAPAATTTPATVGATGLPPVSGGSYGKPPGAVETASTTPNGAIQLAGAVGRRVGGVIRWLIVASATIFTLLAFSLWYGWPMGVVLALVAATFALMIFGLAYPKISAVATALALWKGGAVLRRLAGGVGLLLVLVAIFFWWPVWHPEEGVAPALVTSALVRRTVVLVVLALAAFVAAGAGPMFRTTAGVIGATALAVVGILVVLYGAAWILQGFVAPHRAPPPPTVQTHVLVDGEVWTLPAADADILMTAPAVMRKGACIHHAPGARNFWTDSPSSEFQTRPNCGGLWRKESPGKQITDGRLLACIGVHNPGDQDMTFWIRSRR